MTEDLIPLALLLGFGVASGWLARRLGASRRGAILVGVSVAGLVGAVLVALALTTFEECGAENREPAPPNSYHYSPRRQVCNDGSLEALLLYLAPVLAGLLGGLAVWLHSRTRLKWLWPLAVAAACSAVVLPAAYVRALPYYRLDDYAVFYAPLLRAETKISAARACYTHGVQYPGGNYRDPTGLDRVCVELGRTPQAARLTTSYDGGMSIFELQRLADQLSQTGLPEVLKGEPVESNGLRTVRVYRLSYEKAAQHAQELR
jgi:hypothetical protein